MASKREVMFPKTIIIVKVLKPGFVGDHSLEMNFVVTKES